MTSMHTTPTNYSDEATDSRLSRYLSRFREGPLVVVLMLAVVAVASFTVEYGGWDRLVVPVGGVGFTGAAAGVLLSKLRMSDAVAHFWSLALGVVCVGLLLLRDAEEFGARLIDRVRPFGEFVVDWYLGRQATPDQQHLLISFLLGLLVWLFGFLSAWALFRRGWLIVALALPAALALISLRYAPEPHPWPWVLGVMLALSVPIASRMFLLDRERRWARKRMAAPMGLGSRFVLVGVMLSLLATLTSVQTPEAWSRMTFSPLIEQIGETYQTASERATEWMDQLTSQDARDIQNAGSYTSFDEAFSIGGPLNLTDQPEVLVQTSSGQAPYLTARTYDQYTGRGWASSTDDVFGDVETDRGRLAPELLFAAGQEVVLSDDVTGSRVPQTTTITPLSGPSGVLFTVDTYLTSDVQSVVRMSWQGLTDTPFPISTETLNSLPPDLQKLGNLLLQAELSGRGTEWGPEAVSPTMQREIEDEVDFLAGRGLLVRWDASQGGIVGNLYVTGRLPVFDDVEAVFPRNAGDAQVESTYRVRSLPSIAPPDQLAAAPTDYPSWVTDRYLQLGDTVTGRTTDLAVQVVGDAVDPFTQAVRIEAFLREHITYDENVGEPPADSDLVDYVLFDSQRGYCEHYSASMTVMMRSLGVPARTVVGYYPGEYDDARSGFLYRQLNAHAWTEVFFPGYGWIAFEPTANRPLGERDSPIVGEQAPAETPMPTQPIPTPDVRQENFEATPIPDDRALDNPSPPEPMVEGGTDGMPAWIWPALGVVGAALFASMGCWLAWNRKFRDLSPAEAIFAKTERVGQLGGVRNGPTTTPREYANRFSAKMPAMGPPVRRIVQVYESDRYGRGGVDEGALAAARAAWHDVRRMAVRMFVGVRRRRKGA